VTDATEPKLSFFDATGGRIAWFEWGTRGQEPLLLIHATGFHARVWDRTIAALKERYHVIAVDTRGHGRSEKRGPVRDWRDMADDIHELLLQLALPRMIGAGHSMGGHLLVQLAARMPEQFSRLVLVDPVIMSPEVYEARKPWPPEGEHPVARRRNSWESWEAMFELFSHRKPYNLWQRDVRVDYCRHGVMPKADGSGVELACPPAIEASVYMVSGSSAIHDEARSVKVPVTVLRARLPGPGPRDLTDFTASPTWPDLASLFEQGRDVFLPDLTHFIPMQDPALTADYIAGRR